jgi:hypothetical protein
MALAKAHKTLGELFSNEVQTVKLTYDFAQDGGGVGNIDLATFARKAIVLRGVVHVETACTSGDAATVAIGINDTDADAFTTTTTGAVANLVDDAVLYVATTNAHVAQVDDTVRLAIGAHALTAGKINVIIQYMNID